MDTTVTLLALKHVSISTSPTVSRASNLEEPYHLKFIPKHLLMFRLPRSNNTVLWVSTRVLPPFWYSVDLHRYSTYTHPCQTVVLVTCTWCLHFVTDDSTEVSSVSPKVVSFFPSFYTVFINLTSFKTNINWKSKAPSSSSVSPRILLNSNPPVFYSTHLENLLLSTSLFPAVSSGPEKRPWQHFLLFPTCSHGRITGVRTSFTPTERLLSSLPLPRPYQVQRPKESKTEDLLTRGHLHPCRTGGWETPGRKELL